MCARSVRHNLKQNIFPSVPSTYYYIWFFESDRLVALTSFSLLQKVESATKKICARWEMFHADFVARITALLSALLLHYLRQWASEGINVKAHRVPRKLPREALCSPQDKGEKSKIGAQTVSKVPRVAVSSRSFSTCAAGFTHHFP